MRLKQVKLSGFKSFCDPTTFDLPGQLVGVVGPNGCGKSNIIDAARWVLGESRAAELRGESMQDVIFNGSGERKPASRASVEMVFDNTLGRVGGAWSGFAEISVKRVLTRDGQSTYLINQQVVRRKDVHDIFLGTGLGPRAYAIIGQGTISRIIEAKPDELRVFFEEAAGVSKYKERRKETENRLSDTRDNLTRVEDILRELNGQIEKLDQQAQVAGQFRALESERADKQQWLWMIRRDDALAEQARIEKAAVEIGLAIESQQAQLRAVESQLAQHREGVHQSNDEVTRRQASFYEVNSRIASLENQIGLVTQNRNQLNERIAALAAQVEGARTLSGSSAAQLGRVGGEIEVANERRLAAQERVAQAGALLADSRQRDEQSREALERARHALAEAQQAMRVIDVRRHSIEEAVTALTLRQSRLQSESDTLDVAPLAELERLQMALEAAREQELASAQEQESLETQVHAIDAQREPAQQSLQAAVGKTSTIEARIGVLSQLQARMHSEQKVKPWLIRHGIPEGVERVWQRVSIEPGWELAVEAALRERVHSLEIADPGRLAQMLDDSPPGKVGLFLRDGIDAAQEAAGAAAGARHAAGSHLAPLATMVKCQDPQLASLIAEWLGGFFAADTAEKAFAARSDLPAGGRFVVKAGHAIGRFDVSLFALDSDEDGVLARQQELQNLAREHRAQRLLTDEARQLAEQVEASASALLARLSAARETHERALRRASTAAIEHDRMAQAVSQRAATNDRLAGELAEIAQQLAARAEAGDEAAGSLAQLEDDVEQHTQALERARGDAEGAAQALAVARTESQTAELALQESSFAVRSAEQQAASLKQQITMADENLGKALTEQERLQAELAQISDEQARLQLEQCLDERIAAEEALSAARGRADELSGALRRLDEERLRLERGQEPLRNQLTDLKLTEQASRLAAEQMLQSLAEVDADEAALGARLALLEARPKPAWLQSEVGRLTQAIARLGSVNLAALDEVTSARERQSFLAAQSADLFEAMSTLENAIRTIDQESRALLQQTYDTVNAEFGKLFPMLFGGGDARLVLTGGEILDAGVQVVAQPPGKKNASIHLLSGGEKALTAIALVFAIFKLNPAPFCLLDEVDAPLDDANTERYTRMVRSMTGETQFVFITHNKIAMEMAEQLIGVTMQERGVSRLVAVDLMSAAKMAEAA